MERATSGAMRESEGTGREMGDERISSDLSSSAQAHARARVRRRFHARRKCFRLAREEGGQRRREEGGGEGGARNG